MIAGVQALIFDVDGTLSETEEAHRHAFNAAFAEAGLGWEWSRDDYRRLLKVTGGKERIAAFAGGMALRPPSVSRLRRLPPPPRFAQGRRRFLLPRPS